MRSRTTLAVLLLAASAAVSTVSAPAASAVDIHVHHRELVRHSKVVGYDPEGPIVDRFTTVHRWTTVENRPPVDQDYDGIADTEDPCIGYCPPDPDPAATESTSTTTTSTGTADAIPSYIVQCESGGDYSAVNADSGAGGAYQIMPSTWALYGGTGLPQDAPPEVQDQIAAEIYAAEGSSPWSCAG